MKEIPLTRGYVALVDDEDCERVSQHRWHASVRKRSDGTLSVYAVRNKKKCGKWTQEYLHRFVLGAAQGTEIDHANGDPLDNTRGNLRACSRSENMRNMRRARTVRGIVPASNAKGVYWHKRARKWAAQATLNGKNTYLGLYESEADAAEAYSRFAKDNFCGFQRM